jgi:3,4-dihydroxy 2-butanone 4-phosphate synthase/GTP cyclohydrolase II
MYSETHTESTDNGPDACSQIEDAYTRVEAAIARLRQGGMVVVVDDPDRENEGDLIIAASRVTTAQMAFLIEHGSGLVCVALDDQRADQLRLPLMRQGDSNEESQGTAFTVTVDHAGSESLGVSARDRAMTARLLADQTAAADDFLRPGAILPLRARAGGVLKRAGHTEAASDLSRLSGHDSVGVLTEVMGPDGTMLRLKQLQEFSRKHDLPLLSIADLIKYRRRTEAIVKRGAETSLPTPFGKFKAIAYRSTLGEVDHIALVNGDVTTGRAMVRVHSECLTGDVFGSQRCDCGSQLQLAMEMVSAAECGVVVYLQGHEGRGIGLGYKLLAYALQDVGYDTVDANVALGLPVDDRDYGVGAAILADLGVGEIRLLTNNPAKIAGLVAYGIRICERIPLLGDVTPDNRDYLGAKRARLGHQLALTAVLAAPAPDAGGPAQDVPA